MRNFSPSPSSCVFASFSSRQGFSRPIPRKHSSRILLTPERIGFQIARYGVRIMPVRVCCTEIRTHDLPVKKYYRGYMQFIKNTEAESAIRTAIMLNHTSKKNQKQNVSDPQVKSRSKSRRRPYLTIVRKSPPRTLKGSCRGLPPLPPSR